MGGRVMMSHDLAQVLLSHPDLPVFHEGRKDGGAMKVIEHPNTIRILFGPEPEDDE